MVIFYLGSFYKKKGGICDDKSSNISAKSIYNFEWLAMWRWMSYFMITLLLQCFQHLLQP